MLLAGGVTAFIVAGRPEGGAAGGGPFRQWLIIGVMVGLALLLTAYAKRSRLSAAHVLLAVAAGLLYGAQDALTRVSGQLFAGAGWGGLFTSWQPYGVALLGWGCGSGGDCGWVGVSRAVPRALGKAGPCPRLPKGAAPPCLSPSPAPAWMES
nr:hypothetical protein [Streptomyces akebiae]